MKPFPQPETSGDRSVKRRLLSYFFPHRASLFAVGVGAVFIGAVNSTIALAVALLMDLFSGVSRAALGGVPPVLNFSREAAGMRLYSFSIEGFDAVIRFLWTIIAAALLMVIVKGAVHYFKEYLLWRVTHKTLMQLKRELFARTVNLPLATFDREKSGELLSRVTYDVIQLESAIRAGMELAKALIYSIVFITAMFLLEWTLTLLALAIFPLSAVLIKVFGDRIRSVSGKVSLNVADYTAFISEAIGGVKIIKAFGREQSKRREFEEKIRANYGFSMKIARASSLHVPIQEIISTIGLLVVLIFCGYRLISGAMTVGDLTGFVVLLTNAYKPIKSLGETNTVIQRAIASGRRIFSLIDMEDERAIVRSGNYEPTAVRGDLKLTNVRFSYNHSAPVLQGIDLQVAAGETVALVGPSGGGKTTLVNLIPRFYPLSEGRIELDGVDIGEFNLSFLRSQMALVPQETLLFAGSIEENIRLGKPDAGTDEIIAACKAAHAHAFISRLDRGYESEVGERGVQLSGGQRQRIAIARAILRNPRILLLDEATSALDSESEQLIQEALERFRRDRTTIVIAHRLSTVLSADRIALIAAGRIEELGTHNELYDGGGLYRKLCDQQLLPAAT